MMTPDEERAKRREKNFKAELKYEGKDEEWYLYTTHNGAQWAGLPVNLHEMKIIQTLLSGKIRELEWAKNE